MSKQVHVCFGTGGVGKTTVSAALGRALAESGKKTLVITCDPARRLADAFGVPSVATPVQVEPGLPLWCFMPEATLSAQQTLLLLVGGDQARLAALQANPICEKLLEGLSGIQELAALAQLTELSDSYDAIVVDTAPTRHALSLLQLPSRVSVLVESRSLRWLGSVARRRLRTARHSESRRSSLSQLLDWGETRILRELDASLGGAPVAAIMELLIAGLDARPVLSRIARAASELLLSDTTRYVVVASPRAGAFEDVAFFHQQLTAVAHAPSWLVVNRALDSVPQWPARVEQHPDATQSLRETAHLAALELSAQVRQTLDLRRLVAARLPSQLSVASVAPLDSSDPAALVREAAIALRDLARTRTSPGISSPRAVASA